MCGTLAPDGTPSPPEQLWYLLREGSAPYGLIVNVVDLNTTSDPVIFAFTCDETGFVVMVKFADFVPAGMNTLAGTVAAALLLESVTDCPPGPAGNVIVAVPTAEVPPVTLVGETFIEPSSKGGVVSATEW